MHACAYAQAADADTKGEKKGKKEKEEKENASDDRLPAGASVLVVENLPFGVTRDEVHGLFKGAIKVELEGGVREGTRGYARVGFLEASEAAAALSMNGKLCKGKPMKVLATANTHVSRYSHIGHSHIRHYDPR